LLDAKTVIVLLYKLHRQKGMPRDKQQTTNNKQTNKQTTNNKRLCDGNNIKMYAKKYYVV
jgi:hypothetical protein